MTKPSKGKLIDAGAKIEGAGNVLPNWKIMEVPDWLWQTIRPALGQIRRSGRSRGKPPIFDEATIRDAQAEVTRELPNHPRWQTDSGLAARHVINFLKARGVTVGDRQVSKTQEKTILRQIVYPVINRYR